MKNDSETFVYKLQKGDYRLLWLLMTPEEIVSEFQERSVSARQIRRLFSNVSKRRTKILRKQMLQKLEEELPPHENAKDLLTTEIKKQKQEALDSIWKTIREKEEQWASI